MSKRSGALISFFFGFLGIASADSTWQVVTIPGVPRTLGVLWTGSKFVAWDMKVDSIRPSKRAYGFTQIWTSTDALTWTRQSFYRYRTVGSPDWIGGDTLKWPLSFTMIDGQFIGGGGDDHYGISPDGVDWVISTTGTQQRMSTTAVRGPGGKILAVGAVGSMSILPSINDSVWQRITALQGNLTQRPVTDGNRWLINGSSDGRESGLYETQNGTTMNFLRWSGNLPPASSLTRLGSRWIAMDIKGRLISSSDLRYWPAGTLMFGRNEFSMQTYQGVTVAAGDGLSPDSIGDNVGVVWSTRDSGTTWARQVILSGAAVSGVAVSPTRWVVAGPNGSIYVSVMIPAPSLNTPADNAVDIPTAPNFSWTGSVDAISYQLQVSTDPAFSTIVQNDENLMSTTRTVGPFRASTMYYWRVRGYDGHRYGVFSATRKFKTVGIPPTPVPIAPYDGLTSASAEVAFSWEPAPGATSYRLQVTTDSTFNGLVVNDTSVANTQRAVGPLAANKTYYWRIASKNVIGTSPYSPRMRFYVGTPTALTPTGSPLSPTTPFIQGRNLRYSVPKDQRTVIRLLDTRGRELTTLVDGMVPAGTYALPLPDGESNTIRILEIKTGATRRFMKLAPPGL